MIKAPEIVRIQAFGRCLDLDGDLTIKCSNGNLVCCSCKRRQASRWSCSPSASATPRSQRSVTQSLDSHQSLCSASLPSLFRILKMGQ